MNNLSKRQKVIIIVVSQVLFLIILVAVSKNVFENEPIRSYDLDKDDAVMTNIPDDLEASFRRQLWSVVANVDDALSQNELYYEIREGTYTETKSGGARGVTFIVDIDAIKQSFAVSIAWSDDDQGLPADILINCPPKDQMKYPETICYGMYNNTYSPELYLPYEVNSQYEDGAPNVYIEEGRTDKTINVIISVCDPEKYKKIAMDYLESTPIKLSEYTINYEINENDAICSDEDL